HRLRDHHYRDHHYRDHHYRDHHYRDHHYRDHHYRDHHQRDHHYRGCRPPDHRGEGYRLRDRRLPDHRRVSRRLLGRHPERAGHHPRDRRANCHTLRPRTDPLGGRLRRACPSPSRRPPTRGDPALQPALRVADGPRRNRYYEREAIIAPSQPIGAN